MLNNSTNSKYRFALFFLPVYCIVLLIIFFKKAYPFFITQPDPSYVYLFNGMNLAGGHWEIGHTDHPGTTVQVFAAVVIFIQHLLSASRTLVYQDVILNPESYLFTCSLILVALFATINYLTGAYVFKHTGSIGRAMLFQIIPLININIVQRAVLLGPEAFIILGSTFLMAYLYVNFAENKPGIAGKGKNNVLIISILSAFLIATKYTCAPVIILVLFMLKGNKDRLKYLGLLLIGFFVFILPALPKFKIMFGWIYNLLTHDGIYGRGQERVVDPAQFVKNLKGIFITDAVFSSIYCVITLAFLIAMVLKIRGSKKVPFVGTIAGVWLAVTTLIAAVAKHCDFHYLIFAECCYPLGLYVSYKIILQAFSSLFVNFKAYEKRLLWGFFSALVIFLIIEKIRYIPLRHPKYTGADKCLASYGSKPLLISVADGLACERMEPALYLGYMYSGALQPTYAKFLHKIYPDTYILWSLARPLTHWDETVPIEDVICKNKQVILYMKGYPDTVHTGISGKLFNWNCEQGTMQPGRPQELFKDDGTMQAIYLINRDSKL